MANLIYRTKDNSSTYGKPRVYLSCHAADIGKYAEPLCAEILSVSNCVVYRYENVRLPQDGQECRMTLSQIQLFVLVCSARYLESTDPVRDFELRYALDNNIPILPVIQAGAAVESFNELCEALGVESLHCLDKNQFPLEVEYRKKFEQYLDYFLINDEDVQKIREQFRACIFLSYRKIDVKLAHQLMQRIHNLEKYYDVAIWYDNFLVPGKSFEDEIFGAMDKSDLFMLAVTSNIAKPNASGEDNYVVRKEYKGALERGKKIVAAALEEPDTKQLLIKFKSLPQCIDAYDDLMLDEALSPLDNKPKRSGAEHDYYIGLAYLNGVDYDIDHEKAFRLIHSAAKAGLDLAMEKLIMMYETGFAVKRNYLEALTWHRKLVKATEEKLKDNENYDYVMLLLERIKALGQRLLELDKSADAEPVFRSMLEYADRYARKFEMVGLYLKVADSFENIGDLYFEKGAFEKAKESYYESMHMIQPLCQYLPHEDSLWFRFAEICQKIGAVYAAAEELDDAKQVYHAALEVLTGFTGELKDSAPVKYGIQNIYRALGKIAIEKEDYEEAERLLTDSLHLIEEIEREWNDLIDLKGKKAIIWKTLADLYDKTSRTAEAAQAFQTAVALTEEYYEENDKPFVTKMLYRMYAAAGIFSKVNDRSEDTERYGNAAAETDLQQDEETPEQEKERRLREYEAAKQRAQNAGTAGARHLYGLSCLLVGICCQKLGQTEEAQAYYREGITVTSWLVEQRDDPDFRHLLASLYYNLFQTAPGPDNIDSIKNAYHIWYKLTKEYPDYQEYEDRKTEAHWEWVTNQP